MSSLIVAIHDVAPDTFEACATIVKALERQGPIRFSLLVVPFITGGVLYRNMQTY